MTRCVGTSNFDSWYDFNINDISLRCLEIVSDGVCLVLGCEPRFSISSGIVALGDVVVEVVLEVWKNNYLILELHCHAWFVKKKLIPCYIHELSLSLLLHLLCFFQIVKKLTVLKSLQAEENSQISEKLMVWFFFWFLLSFPTNVIVMKIYLANINTDCNDCNMMDMLQSVDNIHPAYFSIVMNFLCNKIFH